MSFQAQDGHPGGLARSPGGFEFGLQGWQWPAPVPVSITFFLDGSAMVADQFGRPIKGAEVDGKQFYFACTAPDANRDAPTPYEQRTVEVNKRRVPLATHAQVIECLAAERIDWLKLTRAGTPQLPYDVLRKVPDLPMVEVAELRRIPNEALRKDVLRVRRELNEARAAEMGTQEAD